MAGPERPGVRLGLVAVAVLACCAALMLLGLRGNLAYVLSYRAQVVATMVVVGVAHGLAAVLFQTVTRNRVLTPSVMGFDALFALIQTVVVFFLGANGGDNIPDLLRFILETVAMVGFAIGLYRAMLSRDGGDLYRMLLAGLVCGILFRCLSELMQRLMAPNEFNVLQARLFAQVTLPRAELILGAAIVVAVAAVLVWRDRREWDVVALGRGTATGLGVAHRRAVTRALVLVAMLVAAATALIGPLTFLGFMAAALAHVLTRDSRHATLLPMAALLGVLFLAGGQLVLDRGLRMAGSLSVVVEFIGGGLFLLMLSRRKGQE